MEEILQSIKRIIADDIDEDEGEEAMLAPEEPEIEGDEEEDILELTDLIEDEPQEVPEMEEISAAEPEPEPEPEPAAEPEPVDPLADILSDEAAAASSSAMDKLKNVPSTPRPRTESPSFRSGTTVEDLVIEALRPMLKEWLDANLPGMVEDMVEREIRRISK
ncbi:MAG: DUF2497 domain-containing protein [Rickettsiales bacterium]|nr:DUF2497 domain-containing protein [Rickettsiales bacterium]